MDICEYLYKNRIRKKKEKELLKKKFNSLSLVERNAYESIMEREEKGSLTLDMMKGIPFAVVGLGILALVLKLLLQIDIIEPLKSASILLFKLWIPLILVGVILDLMEEIKLTKLKKRLLKI